MCSTGGTWWQTILKNLSDRLSVGIMPTTCWLLAAQHTHLSTDWVSELSSLAHVNQRLSANSLLKIWARFHSSSWSGHDFSLPLTLWQSSYLTTQAHSNRNNNRRDVKVQGCGIKSWASFFPIYLLSVKQMSGMVLKLQLGTIKRSRRFFFFFGLKSVKLYSLHPIEAAGGFKI